MINASIDINTINNLDPIGTVEVRLPINRVPEVAKEIRSIKETEPIPYFKKVMSVEGFQSAEVVFDGIVYQLNSIDDLEEAKGNAKQARSKGK